MTGVAFGVIGVLSMGIVFGGVIVNELSLPGWIAYPFVLISYPFMMVPFLFMP